MILNNEGGYFMEFVHLAKSKSLWALALLAALLCNQTSADEWHPLAQLRPDARLAVDIYRHTRGQHDAREIHVDLMVKAIGGHYAKYKKVAKVASLGTLTLDDTLNGTLPAITVISASELLAALNQINWPGQHAFYLQTRTDNSPAQVLDGFIPESLVRNYVLAPFKGEDISVSMSIELECSESCYNESSISFGPLVPIPPHHQFHYRPDFDIFDCVR